MRPRVFHSQTSVCQLCDFIAIRHSSRPRTLYQISQYIDRSRNFTISRTFAEKPPTSLRPDPAPIQAREPLPARRNAAKVSISAELRSQSAIEKVLQEVIHMRDNTLFSSSIPSESAIENALTYCEDIAKTLVDPPDQLAGDKDGSAASALLSIDEPPLTKPAQKSHKFSPATQQYVDQLSSIAYSIILHPTVFITPNILRRYVDLQSRLRKPQTFPEVFKLYASKPIPEEGSLPIKYRKQNPNKAANAVRSSVADRALQTALEAKQLVIAMDIVETTYAAKAFHRNKFVRKGLVPATGLVVTPVAAYAVASQLSTYQTTMDSSMATNMAFAGILAYMAFTATIGVVAVATANDQMDRVTWAQGMPLRERWIREQERAAIDRIAGAWGFRETWRRGEEEGEEWDALREWIGRKGMILDRIELMEGME